MKGVAGKKKGESVLFSMLLVYVFSSFLGGVEGHPLCMYVGVGNILCFAFSCTLEIQQEVCWGARNLACVTITSWVVLETGQIAIERSMTSVVSRNVRTFLMKWEYVRRHDGIRIFSVLHMCTQLFNTVAGSTVLKTRF